MKGTECVTLFVMRFLVISEGSCEEVLSEKWNTVFASLWISVGTLLAYVLLGFLALFLFLLDSHYPSLHVWANMHKVLETFSNFSSLLSLCMLVCVCMPKSKKSHQEFLVSTRGHRVFCSFDMMTDEDKEATIKKGGVCFQPDLCEHVQDAECAMARKQGGRRGRAHRPRSSLWEQDGDSYFWPNNCEICQETWVVESPDEADRQRKKLLWKMAMIDISLKSCSVKPLVEPACEQRHTVSLKKEHPTFSMSLLSDGVGILQRYTVLQHSLT